MKDGYRKFVRQGRCLGHSAPVVHLDWSSDGVHLQSNSADNEVMVWSVATGRPVRDIDAMRDLVWATSDCTVQWSALGLWGETVDSADPSTASMTQSRDLLGAGDTWGRVKLYSNPACQPRSLCHTYTGHSNQVRTSSPFAFITLTPLSQVCGLSWTVDSTKMLSVGGKDTAVLQWSLQ